jgi:hypothetical protein
LDNLIEQLGGEKLEPLGAFGRTGAGVEVVEDVVGTPREAVQRVNGRPLFRRQQPGGEEERSAVFGVEQPALLVGVTQCWIAHTRGVEL